MRIASLVVAVVGLCPLSWALDNTLPAGASSLRFRYEVSSADDFFDTEGHRQTLESRDYTSEHEGDRFWFEYQHGLSDAVSILFEAESLSRDLTHATGSFRASGPGDVYMALRQRLSRSGASNLLISEVGVSVPAGYSETDPLPLGSGGVDWFAIMTYGQNFYPFRGSFQLDIGYVFRNERPDDEIHVATDLELGLTKSLWIKFQYASEESSSRSLIPYDILDYPQEHGRRHGGATLTYNVSNQWHLELVFDKVLGGRAQLVEETYGLGFGWKK